MAFWLSLVLVGCSAADSAADGARVLDSGLTGGADGDGVGSLDSGPPEPAPTWWVARGAFRMSAGEASDVLLEIEVQDADRNPLCEVAAAAVGVIEVQPTPDPSVYLWLEAVDLRWEGACLAAGGAPVGPGVRFGVGALHPDVRAVVGSTVETAPGARAEAFNGAFLQAGEGAPPYAVGVAGPAAAWEGGGTPTAAAPLPDGDWRWQALYAMPFTGWVAPEG